MKIISIQGNFGNINSKMIEFSKGFTIGVQPNSWGKSTLCAFLRVMFYGLNTSKRDTKDTLSDKTKFVPHNDKGMYGRLTIEYQGRNIVITRESSKAGPMQKFTAFYEDTGDVCTMLNSKNCGYVLFGMGEDAFCSSVFIDGTMLMRPSEEIRERMVAMAQTGDTMAQGVRAVQKLERWKLDYDSGNGHGIIPRTKEQLAQSCELLSKVEILQSEIDLQKKTTADLMKQEKVLEKQYGNVASNENDELAKLNTQFKACQLRIDELQSKIPDEKTIQQASDALFSYEGARDLENGDRQKLKTGKSQYQFELEQLELERIEHEKLINKQNEPKIRTIPLVFALLLAIASAITHMVDIEWGEYSQYVPWVLSGLSVVGLIASFAGSKRTEIVAERNFEEERKRLKHMHDLEENDGDMAATVIQDSYKVLMKIASEINPQITTTEQAMHAIYQIFDDINELKKQKSIAQSLFIKINETEAENSDQSTEKNQLKTMRECVDNARIQLANMQGRVESMGTKAEIEEKCKELAQKHDAATLHYDAICYALKIVKATQSQLTARVAPLISEKTCEYMAFLTDGEYLEVHLDSELNARCSTSDGKIHDFMQLSTGTRDQLYFALRLAVSEVLEATDETSPIILDDPFMTFDDDRTERGLELLARISKERQVILFSSKQYVKR